MSNKDQNKNEELQGFEQALSSSEAFIEKYQKQLLMGVAAVIILILGVLAGIASNNMQYMIAEAAPEAPDFANGMFLTSANLGTTIGTAVCGAFITEMGTRYSVFGALFFLIASIVFVYLRVRVAHSQKQVKMNMATE